MVHAWKFGTGWAWRTGKKMHFSKTNPNRKANKPRKSTYSKVSRSKKMPKKKRSYRTKAKRVYSRAKGISNKLGLNRLMNWKNTGVGVAAIIGTRKLQPFGGEYKPELDMVIAGTVTTMAGFKNDDLVTAGAKMGIAHLVDNYLLGGQGISVQGALGL